MNEASGVERSRGRHRSGESGRDLSRQQPLRAHHIYEIIRREGEEELDRPGVGLFMSGLAAGIAIGTSIQAKMMLSLYLPDEPWAVLIRHAAYPVGFLLVILGRLQLFTEHTITAVTPVALVPSLRNFGRLFRLWGLVFAANILGTAFAAWFTVSSGAFPPGAVETLLSLNPGLDDKPFLDKMLQAVGAGFLIAALVWLLPSVRASQVAAIFVMTYLIALCDYAHVIAGNVEALAHVFAGRDGLGEALLGFMLPTLVGNLIGGTTLFTLLVYSQVRHEAQEEASSSEP